MCKKIGVVVKNGIECGIYFGKIHQCQVVYKFVVKVSSEVIDFVVYYVIKLFSVRVDCVVVVDFLKMLSNYKCYIVRVVDDVVEVMVSFECVRDEYDIVYKAGKMNV